MNLKMIAASLAVATLSIGSMCSGAFAFNYPHITAIYCSTTNEFNDADGFSRLGHNSLGHSWTGGVSNGDYDVGVGFRIDAYPGSQLSNVGFQQTGTGDNCPFAFYQLYTGCYGCC